MTRVAIVDYGMGNLRSVAQAVRHVAPDASVEIVTDPAAVRAADRVILPGQGAMPDCMRNLAESELQEAVLLAARTKPLFGVCIGEQMLCDFSEEGSTDGLGVVPGKCVRFALDSVSVDGGRRLKVPHMGWNRVRQVSHGNGVHPLWDGIAQDSWFYFVHSYHVVPSDPAHSAGVTDYAVLFTSAIARDNIFATQFHPEKSAAAGLRLYRNFVTWNP